VHRFFCVSSNLGNINTNYFTSRVGDLLRAAGVQLAARFNAPHFFPVAGSCVCYYLRLAAKTMGRMGAA
jgi:hypothetical protein